MYSYYNILPLDQVKLEQGWIVAESFQILANIEYSQEVSQQGPSQILPTKMEDIFRGLLFATIRQSYSWYHHFYGYPWFITLLYKLLTAIKQAIYVTALFLFWRPYQIVISPWMTTCDFVWQVFKNYYLVYCFCTVDYFLEQCQQIGCVETSIEFPKCYDKAKYIINA